MKRIGLSNKVNSEFRRDSLKCFKKFGDTASSEVEKEVTDRLQIKIKVQLALDGSEILY